jgi:hypothetical protein
MITSELLAEYNYNGEMFSVNGDPVSQWAKVADPANGYEVTDYHTGKMYQDLFEGDAKRLALQIASARAYAETLPESPA